MSADNIVVIKREVDGKLRAYHRSMSAYSEGQYDYEGLCMFCGGTGLDNKTLNGDGKCDACDNGYYTPPKETPIFEADTCEEAIHKYDKWLEDDEFGIVEYGYTFEGLEPNKETVRAMEEYEKGECTTVDTVEELMDELEEDKEERRRNKEADERALIRVRELIGELSWGIELPTLFLTMDIVDGKPVEKQAVHAISPENAKRIYDVIYEKVKKVDNDFLGEARDRIHQLEEKLSDLEDEFLEFREGV